MALFALDLANNTSYLAPIMITRAGDVTAVRQTVGVPVAADAALTTPIVLPDLPPAVDGDGTVLTTVRPDGDGFAQVLLSTSPGLDARVVLRDANGKELRRAPLQTDLDERTLLAQTLRGPVL